MAQLIINKSILNKEVLLEKESREETLSKAIYNCREVKGFFIIAKVNHTIVPAADWHLFKLNTFDRIELTARPQKGALPYIGAVVGVIVTWPTGGWGGAAAYAVLQGAAIGYAIGSMADSLLFPPSLPNMQLYTGDGTASANPNYGWDGARLVTQPGGPKTVLYGQHRISGALIMQYIDSDGAFNNLNMLINLGQGEIEGIMLADGSGICTAVSSSPSIERETATAAVGVADVNDYYANPTDVSTGTFSAVPAHTRTLTVNGIIKGCFISVVDRQFLLYARPIFFYKSGGTWYQKNGEYTNLTNYTDTPFSFSVETPNADITDFYVTFNSLSVGAEYSIKIFSGESNRYYKYIHLTTYTTISITSDYALTLPDIEINGQGFRYFENISWNYRAGTYNQTVIDEFHETKTYFGDGRKVESPATYTTTGTSIDGFEVQLTCPLLYKQDSQGNIVNNSVTYKIEYQVVGAGSWTDGGTYTITGASKTTTYEYRKFSNLTSGQYNIRIIRITPVYSSFRDSGDLYLGGVTEISYENIAYRNSALLSLKLRANDQLSGSTPNITALVRGLKILVPKLTVGGDVQTYDSCYWDDVAGVYKLISDDSECTDTGEYVRQWSRNPIWCSRDFILNKRYGLGNYIDSGSFNETAAATEAKYCWELVTDFNGGTEHRFEMDLPISSHMSAQEALKMLSRCFRGWFVWSNGMYKPVIDREKDPEQLFNGSNIKPGSLKTTYLKASQVPNIVEIQYANPDRNYDIDPLEIVDEAEWTSVKPPRPNTINAIGTVRTSENIRNGKYYLNCAKSVTKIQEFISPGDAIHCEPGDTIRIQDDLLAWGVGGRIIAADANSITTNIDITYSASYEVRVRLPDFTLEVRTVSSITNNGRTINVSAPFSAVPLVDSVFTYGATGVDSKPFKVKVITRLEDTDKERDMYRLLVAEESSNKYLDTTGVSLPDPKYTTLTNPTQIPNNITDLTMTEMANRPGFYVAFNIPQNDFSFHHADLFLSLDNINWFIYRPNINTRSNIEVLGAKPGQTYYAKVVAYNKFGIANLSPVTANITISDVNFLPPDINGLRLDGEISQNTLYFTKKDAKFVWRKTGVTSGAGLLPAGQEELGAGEYFNDNYKYWIEIWVAGIKIRKEIVSDSAYVYTFEKNVSDNGTAQNTFMIMVWAYNEDANYKSVHPTTLTVMNPAAPAVTNLSVTHTGSITQWESRDLEVRWDATAAIDFKQYIIIIKDGDTGSIRRTEYGVINRYVYTYAKNAVDGSDTPEPHIEIEVYVEDTFGNISSESTITVINSAPSTPSGLSATPRMLDVIFTWDINSEPDILYYLYRLKVESDAWSEWETTIDNKVDRFITDTEKDDYGLNATIYIEVKAVDTFGNESEASTINGTCIGLNIQPADIEDFAITASKIFTKIPILSGDAWTDNSPGDGEIAWNAHIVYYNGAAYNIEAGNSDKKYIFWSSPLNTYSSSDENPVLGDDSFIIATNVDGYHDIAWNAIANQVIGSAYIQKLAVLDAHIAALSATKIVAENLSVISENAGTITSGSLTSCVITSPFIQTNASSGKKILITENGITLHATSSVGKYGTFKYGDGSKYGSGALAYIQHNSFSVPFYIAAEQTVADFHFYNRTSYPSGDSEIADVIAKDGDLYICTTGGESGAGVFKAVGHSTYEGLIDSLVPIGTVITRVASAVPDGYLECDGAAISRTTYAALFALLGSIYGNGDTTTTFNLPDFRGSFLRGWDHGAGLDPDAATRTDRGDGTGGDVIGAKQADEIISHLHTAVVAGSGSQSGSFGTLAIAGNTGSTGGNETRPVNINVMFCIKY